MKIAIDIRELRRGASTGIGRYLRAFLRYAQEKLSDHSFLLYGDAATDMSGLDWARLGTLSAPWPLSDHWQLPARLKRDGADVFFSPYYKAPLRCPCPYVITIHDLIFMRIDLGARLQPLRNMLERAGAARFAAKAARILTVSEYSKAEIVDILGTDAAKIDVVPNAVPSGFAPADEALRENCLKKYQRAPGFLLYVGSFKPSKNVGALVEAFAALDESVRRRHPLLLVGPHDVEYRRFDERFGKLAFDAGARVLPAMADTDLVALYSSCALCVVPSLFEGFGFPALEAMACGAPVLAAHRTSLPEVVGDSGELCEPDAASLGQAISRLLNDPGRLEELRRRGVERARAFSYLEIGERIFSCLKRCGGDIQ